MKRILIFSVFIFLLAPPAQACMHAWQSRFFILGAKQDSVVALYYDAVRGESGDEKNMAVNWRGTLKLGVFGNDFRYRTAWEKKDVVLDERKYEEQLKAPYLEGLQHARKIPGFKEAKAEKGLFAGYRDSCSFAYVVRDTARMQLRIHSTLNGKEYPVTPATDTTLKVIRYFTHNYGEGKRPIERADTLMMINHPQLSSVRIYNIGGKKLMAAFLGSGSPDVEAAETVMPIGKLARLENHFFEEPTQHHGAGFDFFVWME